MMSAVVLSVEYLDQERAVVTYVPRTTSVRRTRFEVPQQGLGSSLARSTPRESEAFPTSAGFVDSVSCRPPRWPRLGAR
jgi:mRNA-degrading endonuclease toxin of MazEF toxin-antitoxin module